MSQWRGKGTYVVSMLGDAPNARHNHFAVRRFDFLEDSERRLVAPSRSGENTWTYPIAARSNVCP